MPERTQFRDTGSGGLEVLDVIWKGVPQPAADEIKHLRDVLRAYEQWEADLILSDEAWGGQSWPGGSRAYPQIPEALWDRLLEIQTQRNALIGR